jgi:hypothetical protein
MLMLLLFHYPLPWPFLLACSMNPSSVTLLWQTKRQKERRTFQDHLFHFLLILPTFAIFGHLDPVSKHCPSQYSFYQNRYPNSVSQNHSVDNFFQALSIIPFALLSALFLPTWHAGKCHSYPYYHWVI